MKEYEVEAEVLDEEQPLEKPTVTWGKSSGERHFTMTFKFKGPERKEDPEKKSIDKLHLEVFSTDSHNLAEKVRDKQIHENCEKYEKWTRMDPDLCTLNPGSSSTDRKFIDLEAINKNNEL